MGNKKNPSYSRLDKEIKIEEESRKLNKDNVANFKKSQKPKKKLRNKILAWVLGGSIFAGAVVGGTMIYKEHTEGDTGYNKEIQTKYELVDETLTNKLKHYTEYSSLNNPGITHIRFLDSTESEAKVQVFYKGDVLNTVGTFNGKGYAIFKILIDYYNALVEAEESNNMLYYLDALNLIFKEMEFEEKSGLYEDIKLKLNEDTEENRIKFNEIFNIDDVENPDVIRQVGFLPFDVQVVEYSADPVTYEYKYTYRISGISYCEVKSESSDEIKNSDNLIIENDYDKNHIKTFRRDILFSCSETNTAGIDLKARLSGDIYKIIHNINDPYAMTTTLFEEVNLMELFEKMKEGNFNFEKPEDFDLKEYIKNQEEEIENAK